MHKEKRVELIKRIHQKKDDLEKGFLNVDTKNRGLVATEDFRRVALYYLSREDIGNIEKILSECFVEDPDFFGPPKFNYSLFLAVVEVAASKIDSCGSDRPEVERIGKAHSTARFQKFQDSTSTHQVNEEKMRRVRRNRPNTGYLQLRTPATPPPGSTSEELMSSCELKSTSLSHVPGFGYTENRVASSSHHSEPFYPYSRRISPYRVEDTENRNTGNNCPTAWSVPLDPNDTRSLSGQERRSTKKLSISKCVRSCVIPVTTKKSSPRALMFLLQLLMERRLHWCFKKLPFSKSRVNKVTSRRSKTGPDVEVFIEPDSKASTKDIGILLDKLILRRLRASLLHLKTFTVESRCIEIYEFRSNLRTALETISSKVENCKRVSLSWAFYRILINVNGFYPSGDVEFEDSLYFDQNRDDEELLSQEEAMEMCRQAEALASIVKIFELRTQALVASVFSTLRLEAARVPKPRRRIRAVSAARARRWGEPPSCSRVV